MALKITKGGDLAPPQNSAHPQVVPEQMEVFGRLRMTATQIAQYYGLTAYQVRGLLRRTDLREAYDRGRSETVVAIRQRQLQVALGSTDAEGNIKVQPDVRMLIHAGYMYGDQSKEGVQEEPEDFEPSRFSWDTEMKERLAKARQAVLSGAASSDGNE